MLPEGLELREFDPQEATDAEWAALNAFENRMFAETRPEYPSVTVDETMRIESAIPDFERVPQWLVWQLEPTRIVARGHLHYVVGAYNQHASNFGIEVLPERWCEGIATALLQPLAESAAQAARITWFTGTSSTVPAGGAFMRRLGAHPGLEMTGNELDLNHLDRTLIQRWQTRSSGLQTDFEMGFWSGSYPEAELEAISRLHQVMNSMPRGDLELEDETWSVDELRERDASLLREKTERWTIYLRDRESSRLAGFTEVFWRADHPDLLNQGDTGVFPEYRNRGLGTWLKAAMLDKVMANRPEVKLVHTWNAASNEAMLRINNDLGFKVFRTSTTWQVGLDKVQAYLQEKGIA